MPQKKENFKIFERALRVLVKYTTISSSKSPKSYFKLVTYMNNDNGFYLLIAAVFSTSTQLVGLGHKDQDLVIPFFLSEGENLPYFHLRALTIRIELGFMQYQTGKINNLTGKYIMELSKLKHLQGYMTPFDLDYRKFECNPQSLKLSLTFTPKIEETFEITEIAEIDMTPPN